ncbi:TPA: hypothetical protein NIB67_002113 [Pseudomonas aeruginosa]|nr:hypothetical protein [Pseudomonas aeruginosa]HEP8062245.1 hypothetical protein [Pseudomonas aeruginosa]
MKKKPDRIGFLAGQLSFGDDFDTLGQAEIEAAFHGDPDSAQAAEPGLATTEEGHPQRCQVCEFPKIAGKVEGELAGQRYSLRLCASCLNYTILTLREQYEQSRLFDDNFDFKELEGFGKGVVPVDTALVQRVQDLVGGIDVDLREKLNPDDE